MAVAGLNLMPVEPVAQEQVTAFAVGFDCDSEWAKQ